MKIAPAVVLGFFSLGSVACGESGTKEGKDGPVPMVLRGRMDSGDPGVVKMTTGNTFCSASVIAPRYVLTAAHCVREIDLRHQPVFAAGKSVVKIHLPAGARSFSHDVAVLELSGPTTVTPIPVNLDENALSRVTDIRAVGFGLSGTYNHDDGVKRVHNARVRSSGDFLRSDPGAICYGDSGGPALATVNGRETIIGVTSYSVRAECEYGSAWVRTDRHREFLARFVDDRTVPEPIAREPAPAPDPIAENPPPIPRILPAPPAVDDLPPPSPKISHRDDGTTVIENGPTTVETGPNGVRVVTPMQVIMAGPRGTSVTPRS